MKKRANQNGKHVLKGLCVGLGLMLALSACTSSDPLARLQGKSLDSSMDETYWKTLAKKSPEVWKQATTYCFAHGYGHPNCDVVTEIAVYETPHMQAPQIGHSGHYVTLPTHLDY